MFPYLIMILLYVGLALLIAFETAFSSWRLLDSFSGLVWLRVHLITLGVLAQLFFGGLPMVTAMRRRLPRPKLRWDIWLLLNAGIAALLVGIPMMSAVPIIAGGTLVFAATLLLMEQLYRLKGGAASQSGPALQTGSRKFYLAGLGFFLLGILVGTGLWTGWSAPLGIVGNAKEVHIHANSWGLMSLVFAGLLFDFWPLWTGRSLPNPGAVTPIFWLMTLGALGLVFGPWLANYYLLVPGLIMHLVATTWLLREMIVSLGRDLASRTPGVWHLVGAYFWILAPIMMAPFVLFEVPGLPGATIEAKAPQALIYGWVLQFGFAIIPYFFSKILLPDEPASLGGSWFSLLFLNLGGVALWASIFINTGALFWHGLAYGLWISAMVPLTSQLFALGRQGFARLEALAEPAAAD